jgi:hypothetical protein
LWRQSRGCGGVHPSSGYERQEAFAFYIPPNHQDAIGYQIIPHAASANGNVIDPGGRFSGAFFDTVLPNGVRLGDVTLAQVGEAAEHLARMARMEHETQAEDLNAEQ